MEYRDHGKETGLPPIYTGAGKAQGLRPRSDVCSEDSPGESGSTWRGAQDGSTMFCFPLDEATCCDKVATVHRNCEGRASRAIGDAVGHGGAGDAAWIVAAICVVSAASVTALAPVSAATLAMACTSAASALSSTQQSDAAPVMAFMSAATSASSPVSAATAVSTVSR